MAIHCIHCGTELPDIANFCLICGKPTKDGSRASMANISRTEYTQVYFDLSSGPALITRAGVSIATSKPKVEPEIQMMVNQRVNLAIQPLLAQGWVLDGTWDSAVDIDWVYAGNNFWTGFDKHRLRGATVKFRRNA